MSDGSRTPASTKSTSGIEYIKFAASGRNKFVTLIALLAALGGFKTWWVRSAGHHSAS